MTQSPWPVLAPAAGVVASHAPLPPTMSVVIAAYQAAATIEAAVHSISAQTLPALEIVVCNDGSTDHTGNVLAELAAELGGGLVVVSQANGGEGAAKNAAVRAARGEFVVVLDADDIYLPQRLEALAYLAESRPDLDVLLTDAFLEVGGVTAGRAYHRDWSFPIDDQRAAILSGNFVLGMAAVRRARWLEVDGFAEDLHHAADWDFFTRLILSGSQVGMIDVPLAVYRLAPGGLSSQRDSLVAARVAVLERALARVDLSSAERRVAAFAFSRQRALLRTRRARTTLVTGAEGARRAALTAAVSGTAGPRARVALSAGALAPRLVSQRWAGRSTRTELPAGLALDSSGQLLDDRTGDNGSDGQHPRVWLRGVAVAPDRRPWRLTSELAAPLVGSPDRPIAAVFGDAEALAAAGRGLGANPPADAVAARLRAAGAAIRWAQPVLYRSDAEVYQAAYDAGRRSVAALRADPTLITTSRAGSWASGRWQRRALRRVGIRMPFPMGTGAAREDVHFWRGVRRAATATEWRRLTRSYVALAYHRVAGEALPGQERYDVAPARFHRQLALLQALRWQPLAPEELRDVHCGSGVLEKRRYVVTLDDGYADAVEAAAVAGAHRPHIYLPTGELGSIPNWAAGRPLADWPKVLEACDAGVVAGSHARIHVPLTAHPPERLRDEIAGSRKDLEARLDVAVLLLAYPNGRHSKEVRAAAHDAGYTAAWTTMPGRNGAGVDRFCLRRISIKDWDGPLSFLWKVVTGEPVPRLVDAVNSRRWRLTRLLQSRRRQSPGGSRRRTVRGPDPK